MSFLYPHSSLPFRVPPALSPFQSLPIRLPILLAISLSLSLSLSLLFSSSSFFCYLPLSRNLILFRIPPHTLSLFLASSILSFFASQSLPSLVFPSHSSRLFLSLFLSRGPARISRFCLLSLSPTISFLSPNFPSRSIPPLSHSITPSRDFSLSLHLSFMTFSFIPLVFPILPSASLSPVSIDFNSAISLPLDLLNSPVHCHFRSFFQYPSFSSPLISLRSSQSLYLSPPFVLLPLCFLSRNLTYSPLTVKPSIPWSIALSRVFFSPFYLDFSPSSLHSSAGIISSISLFSTLLGKIVNIFLSTSI